MVETRAEKKLESERCKRGMGDVTHFRSRLLMVVILFGAMLLPMGLSPQEAQSQDQTAQEPLFDKDPKGNDVVSGEVLVSYKRGTSKEAVDEVSKLVEGQVDKDFPEIEVQLISFPKIKNEQNQEVRQQALGQKKEDLERNPNVEAVEYNQVIDPSWIPSDPFFIDQWAYKKIRAPEAWDLTQGSSTVKVAIIDTGIDSTHPDLSKKLVGQYDFAYGDSVAQDTSGQFNGHGTHVSGIVAAQTDNGGGVAGTCPNCQILMAKYWDAANRGTISKVVQSINWAVMRRANVINMSFGNGTYSNSLERSVNLAWDRGIVLVAAAGNAGTDGPELYPAAYAKVIAVAATNKDDSRRSTSNAGDWVDVAAPGTEIYSTVPTGSYGYKSGTSVATPYVSGLAGLLFSQGYSNSEVRFRIQSTAVDLGKKGKDPVFGSGRIDARAAVQ
jgi:thermitase